MFLMLFTVIYSMYYPILNVMFIQGQSGML